jgi:excinuclease ABC subunit C
VIGLRQKQNLNLAPTTYHLNQLHFPLRIFNMINSSIQTKLENLPTKPGVYLMKDARGKIIYVGKAKSLRNRVRSYFHDSPPYHPKIATLISKIADFDIIATDSEMEALILEANLIKKHKPRYNVNLKDDKRYPYLKVTAEPYPRVLVVRRVKEDRAKYFGPYTNVKAMRNTLRLLRRIFQVRSCNYALPSHRKIKLCLDYHIKRCAGPCEDKVSQNEYQEIIKSILLFLSGKNELLLNHLQEKMSEYSEKEEFEKAASIRDQIKALQSVTEKQKVAAVEKVDRDVIAYARKYKDIAVVTLQIREGVLVGRQNFHLTGLKESTDREVLSHFLRQYYMHSAVIPPQILLPTEIDDQQMIEDLLSAKKGGNVKMVIPQRGEKLKIMEMAAYNARLSLEELMLQRNEAKKRVPASIEALRKDLYLSLPPRKIAALDISNLGPSNAVGSLVFFEDSRPRKSQYRKFKIKTVKRQDDFAMLAEVTRRYFAYLNREDKGFPDLLLVDGGKGQLSSVVQTLNNLGTEKPNVIALAKRLDEVFLPDKPDPLMIPKGSISLKLLQRIRDEAHRFAVQYHRQLSKASTIKSELDQIPGIGPKKREVLLKHFGSVEQIRHSSLKELLQAIGIDKRTATNVYRHFHTES